MLAAIFRGNTVLLRANLAALITLSIASAALAAESQASSMAGGMYDTSASYQGGSEGQYYGGNESSGQSSSLSATERTSSASAYDSSLTGAGPNVAVKNVATDNAQLKNPVVPAGGVAPAAASGARNNGLIENNVRQKASDFATVSGASAAAASGSRTTTQINMAAPAAVSTPARVPHAKIQYWNQKSRKHNPNR